ncbi:hypothetical protein BVY02_02030 [bacterium J17]|nr:hypothetical protein BVY02_02030 [bacterium J17]
MSLIFRLAWRNIWRNPRRTVLTLAAIAFAATVLVFFVGLQMSSYDASIQATVSVFNGEVQIQRDGYLKRPTLRKSFSNSIELKKQILSSGLAKFATRRSFGFALFSSETRAFGAQIVGVEPESEKELSTIPQLVKKGRYLKPSDENAVVVGQDLAANLNVEVGSEINYIGQARDGSLAANVLEVVGIFRSGSRDIDRAMVQIPISVFDTDFAMEGDVHSIVLSNKDVKHVSEMAAALNAFLVRTAEGDEANQTLLLHTWEDLMPGLRQSIDLDMASSWLFYLSLVFVVNFGILNTFLMSVLERTKEFGTMLALGAKPSSISGLILFECSLLTFIGLVLGVALGSLVILYYGVYGFSIPGSEAILEEWNLPTAVKTKLSWSALTAGPLIIFVAGTLSAVYPALKIYKIVPADALKSY